MSNVITRNNSRGNNLQILDDKRNELAKGLITYKQYLDVIPKDQQESFKKNFLELATQDYLLSIVNTKELIRFAANVTKIGLDISPSSKECYIIPFEVKVNGTKVMLPQAVIPLNGIQQLAYSKGFFLEIHAVYHFDDGSCEAANLLTRLQQSQLRTADPDWVDSHFIGFDVILTDLKKELPVQSKFVELNYVREATKTLQDNRWKIQTWRHKAVRRAYGDCMIPRDRKLEVFEEIESLNDSMLSKAVTKTNVSLNTEIENAVIAAGFGVSKANGLAIVIDKNGKPTSCFGKDQIIKDLGFSYQNNQWTMDYNEEKSPVKSLMLFLKNNGLTNEEMGKFVKEYLGLSSSDVDKIQVVLNDKEELRKKITMFLADQEIPNDYSKSIGL